MGCNDLNESGIEKLTVMGCYGTGAWRLMAALIEQHHDRYGSVWPITLAPFQTSILPLQMNGNALVKAAEALYEELREQGIEVLLDERPEGAGVKFQDNKLTGVPLGIAGNLRGLDAGHTPAKIRRGGEMLHIPLDAVSNWLGENLL